MDPSNQIDFHTSPYFPGSLRTLGVFLLVGVFIPGHVFLKLTFVFIGTLLITTHYRLRFDLSRKQYFDYVWILGFRSGSWDRFDRVEYLFIKRNRMRQNLNSMMTSRTIHVAVYDGYLRISEKNKIHLLTSRHKDVVVKKLRALASLLRVDILDYTDRES